MSIAHRVGQERLELVAGTVAASFANDPIWQWIYDLDGTIPQETGLVLARMLVAQSSPADEIHCTEDGGAVALWTAPAGSAAGEETEVRDARVGPYFAPFAEQLGARLAITGKLSEAMHSHRPQEPHWYLGILGTDPARQNQGLGGAVLQTMLARCDRFGIPTYLESSNPQNYGFYQRHGYTETDELRVEDSPPLLGFWREPRSPGSES